MSTHFRIPTQSGPFCGVCGGVPPDNHYPDCPVLTQEAQAGVVLEPGFQDQLAQQQALGQGLLAPGHYLMEFIGGPLDGPNYVHPAQNYILRIEGDDSGFYECSFGKYYWIRK